MYMEILILDSFLCHIMLCAYSFIIHMHVIIHSYSLITYLSNPLDLHTHCNACYTYIPASLLFLSDTIFVCQFISKIKHLTDPSTPVHSLCGW